MRALRWKTMKNGRRSFKKRHQRRKKSFTLNCSAGFELMRCISQFIIHFLAVKSNTLMFGRCRLLNSRLAICFIHLSLRLNLGRLVLCKRRAFRGDSWGSSFVIMDFYNLRDSHTAPPERCYGSSTKATLSPRMMGENAAVTDLVPNVHMPLRSS